MTVPSEGSVPPKVALPVPSSACCCLLRGRWVWEGRPGHFLPARPSLPRLAQPAVWQTFLGLLIDIQEWNSSRLGRPEQAGTQALCLGSSAHMGRA